MEGFGGTGELCGTMAVGLARAGAEVVLGGRIPEKAEKRLAEIDRSLMVHDEALQDLYEKLLPLLQVEPEPKQRAIGFGV